MNTFIAKRYNVFMALENSYGEFNDSVSSFKQLRPESDGFDHQGKTEILKRSYITQNLGNSPGLVGVNSCSVKMNLPARGGSYSAADFQQAQLCSELEIPLSVTVGNKSADTGTTTASGCTTSILKTSHTTPSSIFGPGNLVFIETNASGEIGGRWISAIDDVGATIDLAGNWENSANWTLDESPQLHDNVFASVNFSPSAELRESSCMEISGISIAGSQPVWKYTGLLGNLKISDGAAQKRVMLEFDLQGDACKSSATLPAVDIASGATAWPSAPVDLRSLGADFRINGTPCAYQSFSLDIGNKWAELVNANKKNGREGYSLTQIATTGKAVVYWDSDLHDKLKLGEMVDISWIVGNSANGIGFHSPSAELLDVKESEINGLLAMEISFAPIECNIKDVPDWTLSFSGRKES